MIWKGEQGSLLCTSSSAAQPSATQPNTTVHKDLSERLREIDRSLYVQVKEILEQNKAERHLRGGDATKRKYQKQRAK